MSREIKFRIWFKDPWKAHRFVGQDEVGIKFTLSNGQIYCNGLNVTKYYELQQFTSLYDCNGEPIYEGDIVTFGQHTYQVIFDVGSFCLFDKNGLMIDKIGGRNDHCYSLMVLYIDCDWHDDYAYDIEVIGNIFENPEKIKDDAVYDSEQEATDESKNS